MQLNQLIWDQESLLYLSTDSAIKIENNLTILSEQPRLLSTGIIHLADVLVILRLELTELVLQSTTHLLKVTLVIDIYLGEYVLTTNDSYSVLRCMH